MTVRAQSHSPARWCVGLLAFVMAGPSIAQGPPSTTVDDKTTVIVLDPIDREVDRDTRLAVSAQLASDLGRASEFSVVTAADIRAMLELEANKQLAGCTTESCLSEVASALGAEIVVTWSIGSVGGADIFSLTLFDAIKQTAAGRGLATIADSHSILGAASDALRDALTAYRRDRGTLSSRDVLNNGRVWVEIKGSKRVYSKTVDRVQIDPVAFYDIIQRPDLTEAYEGYNSNRQIAFWIPMGLGLSYVAVATAGTATLIALGLFQELNRGSIAQSSITISGLIFGAVLLTDAVAVMAGFGVGLLFRRLVRRSTSFAEDRALARQHNRRLAQDLGLTGVDAE